MVLLKRVMTSKKYQNFIETLKKYGLYVEDDGWNEFLYNDMKLNGETPEEFARSFRRALDFIREEDARCKKNAGG